MSTPSPERQFPTHCPGCGRLTATVGEPHCRTATKKKPCPGGWLRCRVAACNTVFDSQGRFYPRKPAGATP